MAGITSIERTTDSREHGQLVPATPCTTRRGLWRRDWHRLVASLGAGRPRQLTMLLAAISLAISLAAPRLRAQTATIEPGMTQTQVVEKLGQPLSTRSFQSFTYLFYRNGCEKRCGMHDIVTLDSGKVVDAVFRSTSRHYTGTSSSPRAIPAAEARTKNPDAPPSVPAKPTPNKKTPPYVQTGL